MVLASHWVYSFGGDEADGNARLRNLLGSKGANLAEMTNMGLPVPPRLHHNHRTLQQLFCHGACLSG